MNAPAGEPGEDVFAVQLEPQLRQLGDHLMGQLTAEALGERWVAGRVEEDRARELASADPAPAPGEPHRQPLAAIGKCAAGLTIFDPDPPTPGIELTDVAPGIPWSRLRSPIVSPAALAGVLRKGLASRRHPASLMQ
jgi:hypothetical protein